MRTADPFCHRVCPTFLLTVPTCRQGNSGPLCALRSDDSESFAGASKLFVKWYCSSYEKKPGDLEQLVETYEDWNALGLPKVVKALCQKENCTKCHLCSQSEDPRLDMEWKTRSHLGVFVCWLSSTGKSDRTLAPSNPLDNCFCDLRYHLL